MREEYELYKKQYKADTLIYVKLWIGFGICVLCFAGYLQFNYSNNHKQAEILRAKADSISNVLDKDFPCEYIEKIDSSPDLGCYDKRLNYEPSKKMQTEYNDISYSAYQIEEKIKNDSFFPIILSILGVLVMIVPTLIIRTRYLDYEEWVTWEKKNIADRLEHQKLKNDLYRAENEYQIIPVEHEGEILRVRNQKVREILDEQLKIDEYLHQIQRLKARRGLDWGYYEKELQEIEIQSKKIEIALKSMPLRELEMKIKEYETVIKPRIQKVLGGVSGRLDEYDG